MSIAPAPSSIASHNGVDTKSADGIVAAARDAIDGAKSVHASGSVLNAGVKVGNWVWVPSSGQFATLANFVQTRALFDGLLTDHGALSKSGTSIKTIAGASR